MAKQQIKSGLLGWKPKRMRAAFKVRKGIGEHRKGMGEHRKGMGEQRKGMGEHLKGMGEHRKGMGEHRKGMGEHRKGIGEQRKGIGEQREGIGAHRKGMGAHRKGMGEHRKGMGEQRADKNKESRNSDLRTTKRSRAQNKAHKRKRIHRKNRDHSSTIDVVLQYAAAGWPVFPLHSKRMNGSCSCNDPHCEQPGKHARVRIATTNPGKIKKYWNRWPHANIGMPMGKGSRFLALVSEGSAGEKALRELEERKA